MATFNNGQVITLPAAGDLSASQYHFVEISSGGEVSIANAITDNVIGILQNSPNAQGEAAAVLISGTSKIVLGGTVATGDLVGTAADGEAQTAASTNRELGIMINGGAAGEIGEMIFQPMAVVA